MPINGQIIKDTKKYSIIEWVSDCCLKPTQQFCSAASSAVDRGFGPQLGQTKDYKIGICCFFAKQAALRSKSKDWLARNQDNVSEWGAIAIEYIYVWKVNPTVVEFDFWADNFFLFLRQDLNSHHWYTATLCEICPLKYFIFEELPRFVLTQIVVGKLK
jgi:hypothetical protein